MAASSSKNIYFRLVSYMTRTLASVRRYPCPAFLLPRPCWPKMIKCHQSTTPKRRAPPYWPSVARQHPRPGPPPRGGWLVTLYHFWSARSGRGRGEGNKQATKHGEKLCGGVCIQMIKCHQHPAAEIHTPDPENPEGKKECNISSRSLPLTILIPLHLRWVRNETTLIFIF